MKLTEKEWNDGVKVKVGDMAVVYMKGNELGPKAARHGPLHLEDGGHHQPGHPDHPQPL